MGLPLRRAVSARCVRVLCCPAPPRWSALSLSLLPGVVLCGLVLWGSCCSLSLLVRCPHTVCHVLVRTTVPTHDPLSQQGQANSRIPHSLGTGDASDMLVVLLVCCTLLRSTVLCSALLCCSALPCPALPRSACAHCAPQHSTGHCTIVPLVWAAASCCTRHP